jgi:cobalamin biosynthesis protein CbiD
MVVLLQVTGSHVGWTCPAAAAAAVAAAALAWQQQPLLLTAVAKQC